MSSSSSSSSSAASSSAYSSSASAPTSSSSSSLPTASSNSKSTASLVTTILSFLEVAIHSILYMREVYPSTLFERRRKYGIPVWMSRHPDLNTYIVKVLRNSKPFFDRGLVRRIIVPISGPDSVVRETYVFQFSGYAAGPALNLRQLEETFKACITRLCIVDGQLPSLPPLDASSSIGSGCTFKIVVVAELDDDSKSVVDQVCVVRNCVLVSLPVIQDVTPLSVAPCHGRRRGCRPT